MTPKNDELMPGYTAQEDFEGRVVTAIREVLGDMGKIDEYRNKNGSDRQAYMSVWIQEYLDERGFFRAAQGEDEGWRAIETAPREGVFLYIYDNGDVCVHEEDDYTEWEPYTGKDKDSGVNSPTHWMPLPAPPVIGEK